MKHICVWLIRFYQKFLSPLKRNPTCRFTPTCSAYAVEAYQKRGFFIGTILTVGRICRCNPFGRCGYDPVPLKGLRYKREEGVEPFVTADISLYDTDEDADITPDDDDRDG